MWYAHQREIVIRLSVWCHKSGDTRLTERSIGVWQSGTPVPTNERDGGIALAFTLTSKIKDEGVCWQLPPRYGQDNMQWQAGLAPACLCRCTVPRSCSKGSEVCRTHSSMQTLHLIIQCWPCVVVHIHLTAGVTSSRHMPGVCSMEPRHAGTR